MKNQLLQLERSYWEAMETHNLENIQKLTYFPCIIAGKNGVKSIQEDTFIAMFQASGSKRIKVLSITEVNSEVIGDTGVIAYVIDTEYNINGELVKFSCACSSTWVQIEGNWKCIMHTESDLVSTHIQ